jgi:hypothetical protein
MIAAQRKVVRTSLLMTAISVALCLLPVVGGIVAGMIGGYRIGGVRRALLAASMAGVLAGVGSWLLLSLTLPHLIGVSAGVAIAAWVVVSEAGLLSGAAIGAISRPQT